MLRLATYYTPSHREMCERFVLSRATGFSEVVSREYPQRCATGVFKSDGWNACMDDKLDLLIRLPTDGMPTLYVDCDVVLLPGLAKWCDGEVRQMGFHDIAYSDDVVQWCAGVMLFRCTARVRAWWQLIANLSPIWNLPDQDVIHQLRQQCADRKGVLPVHMRTLSADRVCNWATMGNMSVWTGEPIAVPSSCVAWHANWTIGIPAKTTMLDRVLETHAGASV